jgi:hypothetical protein
MREGRTPVLTGGCQCGAVRYALYSEPSEPSICHCRMCQKAFGNYFAPLAGVPLADLRWTKGEPGVFKSSELVERGFCRDCGSLPACRARCRVAAEARIAPAPRPGMTGRAGRFCYPIRYPKEPLWMLATMKLNLWRTPSG